MHVRYDVNSTVIDRLHYIAERRIQQEEVGEAWTFEPHCRHDGNSIAKANFVLSPLSVLSVGDNEIMVGIK